MMRFREDTNKISYICKSLANRVGQAWVGSSRAFAGKKKEGLCFNQIMAEKTGKSFFSQNMVNLWQSWNKESLGP